LSVTGGCSDAHRDLNLTLGVPALGCFLSAIALAAPIVTTELERTSFDSLSQAFKVWISIVHRLPGKHHRELFSTIAEWLPATGNIREARCDHLQHLISSFVTIRVVEGFEMIDVDHRNRVVVTHFREFLIQRTTAGELRKLIAIRHGVGSLEDGNTEYESASGEVR